MALPHALVERIKAGRVALFLGAGALFGATLPSNKAIPLGSGLRDLLCKRFLNNEYSDDSLAFVSEMAISAYSLQEVQSYIAEYFNGIVPAPFHLEIPKFKWNAIFTTNYDRLIETCYEKITDRIQNVVIFLSDAQDLEKNSLSESCIPLIKLHGCVTRTHDENLPLILTTDQYNDHKRNREGLFKYLYELAYKNTIVFVGHSLQDSNIRAVLLDLEKEAPNGERHYLLKPGLKSVEQDFWGQKKITALNMTFENFIHELNSVMPTNERILPFALKSDSHPIQHFFNTHSKPSEELVLSLEKDMTVLSSSMPINACDAKEFFRGVDQGWSPIADGVAIHRLIQSRIFECVIEKTNAERKLNAEFYVIKGEAGAGKTVLLRQIAWETMQSNLGISIWVMSGSLLDIYLIEELCSKSGERVFLFWDDAANNAIEMNRFVTKAKQKKLNVTIITAERYNEWNIRCDELDEQITDKFNLTYLSESEIENLVDSLEKYNSLGPNLIKKTKEQRCTELRDIHGRQLLVALHEATMGEPFEDIIYNEYTSIYPEDARNIYLTVCVLNRQRVPVRAGLISRIHDITFEDFQRRFYAPLEKVVISSSANNHDVFYSARHSEIAEIVFRRALSRTEDKYLEYIKILNKLNTSFSSDKNSFRQLIRARSLQDLFSDHADIVSIYNHAQQIFEDDPYLLQQMANYERLRANGSIDKAIELLDKAKEISPRDSSILHSLAVCWRDKAESSVENHLINKAINEARGYLRQIVTNWSDNSYVSATFIELSILYLKHLLLNNETPAGVINDNIRKVQQELTDNKQKYPSDGHVYKLETAFSELINDNSNAFKALQRSFEENDREPYLAIRLSSIYIDKGQFDEAKCILDKAIERRRTDHSLNFHYAELLRNHMNAESSALIYYYRRAFTPNDKNYQAQFWTARFSYFSLDEKQHQYAVDLFDHIRNSRLSFEERHKARDIDGGFNSPRIHTGTIVRKREGFAFILMDGTGFELFAPEKQVNDDLWDVIRERDRVSFNIAFSFNGPFTANVRPA